MGIETHRYEGEGFTVIWEPAKCIHSGICALGLPLVFRPRLRPWILLEGTEAADVKAQVEKCPSGALRYEDAS